MKSGFPACYFADKNCLNFPLINNTRLHLYALTLPESMFSAKDRIVLRLESHCIGILGSRVILGIDGVLEPWCLVPSSDGGMS